MSAPSSPQTRKRKLSISTLAEESSHEHARTRKTKDTTEDVVHSDEEESTTADVLDESQTHPDSADKERGESEVTDALGNVNASDHSTLESDLDREESEGELPEDEEEEAAISASDVSPDDGSEPLGHIPQAQSSPTHASSSSSELKPPLPAEPVPSEGPEDDGWEPVWDSSAQAFYFFNHFTKMTQWKNPRISNSQPQGGDDRQLTTTGTQSRSHTGPPLPSEPPVRSLVAGGYNPAIHGDYDPNADYAILARQAEEATEAAAASLKFGYLPQPQLAASHPTNHVKASSSSFTNPSAAALPSDQNADAAKSRSQLHTYFDVDAVANDHDGRSLKAERAGKRLSKAEVKAYRQRNEDRKREKQRAWLRN